MSNLLKHINMTTLSLFDSLQPFINSSITSFSDAHSDDTKFLSLIFHEKIPLVNHQ